MGCARQYNRPGEREKEIGFVGTFSASIPASRQKLSHDGLGLDQCTVICFVLPQVVLEVGTLTLALLLLNCNFRIELVFLNGPDARTYDVSSEPVVQDLFLEDPFVKAGPQYDLIKLLQLRNSEPRLHT